jgi:flagellum-specific peptidoglycan hydrolase FlgJ
MSHKSSTIHLGNIERTNEPQPFIVFSLNSDKIKRFFYTHWLNIALGLSLLYVLFNWRDLSPFSSRNKLVAISKAETLSGESNKNQKLFDEPAEQAETFDPSFYTEGVIEVLPQRPLQPVTSAYTQGGNEANLFDNVSIFTAPEKAKPEVVKSKQDKCWDYVRRFVQVAKTEREKFGIPVSITLAQGLLESDAGESRLTRSANNHFGIKTFNTRVPHVVLKDDSPTDKFKKYNTAWESYRDHSLFLMRAHYKDLQFLSKRDYVGWARGLEKAGYATDKMYAEKLIKVIENLKLYQLDESL